jgi:hypothetical protein
MGIGGMGVNFRGWADFFCGGNGVCFVCFVRYRLVDMCVARLPLTQRAFRSPAGAQVTFLCGPKEK